MTTDLPIPYRRLPAASASPAYRLLPRLADILDHRLFSDATRYNNILRLDSLTVVIAVSHRRRYRDANRCGCSDSTRQHACAVATAYRDLRRVCTAICRRLCKRTLARLLYISVLSTLPPCLAWIFRICTAHRALRDTCLCYLNVIARRTHTSAYLPPACWTL